MCRSLPEGLIQPNQIMILHSSSELPEQTLKLCEGVFLGGDLQFLCRMRVHVAASNAPRSGCASVIAAGGLGSWKENF